MAIETMEFINIAGPIHKLDDFVIRYVLPRNIEFTNAIMILDDLKGIYPYADENPFESLLKTAQEVAGHMKIGGKDFTGKLQDGIQLDAKETEAYLSDLKKNFDILHGEERELRENLSKKKEILKQLIPLQSLDFRVEKLFHLEFMKFRFGVIPKDSFQRLETYAENLDVVVMKTFQENDKVYILYFMPEAVKTTIDELLSSLYFKRIRISDDVEGFPTDALEQIEEDIKKIEVRLQELEEEDESKCHIEYQRFLQLYENIITLYQVHEVRKYAVRSKEAFYLTGWIPKSDLSGFLKDLETEEDIACLSEDVKKVNRYKPPTKLKNLSIFKPFESLVEMYGIPAYNEMDPTTFVAITYVLMFGMMFGDLGQGLVLSLLGLWVYKTKNLPLAQVVSMAGISSAVFGVLYGSVFGSEEIIQPILFAPMEEKNLMLVIAVCIGVVFIVLTMLMNIITAVRHKETSRILFSKNGIAGLIFYGFLIYLVLKFIMNGSIAAHPVVMVLFIGGPLLAIFLTEPLENWMKGKKKVFPEEKGGYFIEAVFELIETILSFLSNTLSFVRMGAFALNHVGLFMAFQTLADMQGKTGSVIIMILGNILIIGLEGLIVFIQGLRLEYYELFSRFFVGDGIHFKPFKIEYKTK